MNPTRHPSIPVTAYWMDRSPDGSVSMESWPVAKGRKAGGRLAGGPVLVNNLDLAREPGLLPPRDLEHALDLRELFSLALPVAVAEDVPEMLGLLAGDREPRSGAQALAEAWSHLEARFRAWPSALADTVVQLLAAAPGAAWRNLAGHLASVGALALQADPLTTGQALLALVPPGGEKAAKRELPDPEDYEPLDLADVARWLEPDGPCARKLDGYEYREGQVTMARAVAEAFNSRRHLVVEAGTGVGKSVAYLLPGILWALRNHVPVVVSTNTKNLQTQLFHKDIPLLRQVVTSPFRAALIKGRMNYVCLRHLLHMLDQRETELSEEELVPMAKVVCWLASTTTGDLDELDRVLVDAGAPLGPRLPANGEECGGRSCRHYARCLLQRARTQSLNADLVVANHSLVFAEDGPQPLAIPRHAHLVFDEAHNLEESATRHFTVEISPVRFALVLRRLWRGGGRRRSGGLLEDVRGLLHSNAFGVSPEATDAAFDAVTAAVLATDGLRQAVREFFQGLAAVPRAGEAPLRFRPDDLATARWREAEPCKKAVRTALQGLHEAIDDLLKRIVPGGDEVDPPPAVADLLRDLNAAMLGIGELATDLDFVLDADDTDFVYWLDVYQREREAVGALSAAPVDIAARLVEEVFDARQSVVLCSATLSVNGSFQFLAHRIGLDRLEEGRLLTCQAPSPFDYARQCLAAAVAFLPDPAEGAGGAYASALAEFLVALMQRTLGRTLVLFTSYEMMRTCAKVLAPALRRAGLTLLVQGEGGSRDRLTRTFRHDVSSVLLGTDSFWEGVDVMGESLSCVVIARLPFDAVKDPLVSARGERVAQEGGDPFRNFALPNAIIKFRQGFGRLIRHREDRGVVLVADRRIYSKSYGLHFRRNLPCAIQNCPDPDTLLGDVERFLSAPGG